MYCSNCGMKLPDWAHYCERCGARVKRPASSDDPIDHVGIDDTSASEPIWPDDVRAAEAEASEEPVEESSEAAAQMAAQTSHPTVRMPKITPEDHDMATVLMDAAANLQTGEGELEEEYLEEARKMGFKPADASDKEPSVTDSDSADSSEDEAKVRSEETDLPETHDTSSDDEQGEPQDGDDPSDVTRPISAEQMEEMAREAEVQDSDQDSKDAAAEQTPAQEAPQKEKEASFTDPRDRIDVGEEDVFTPDLRTRREQAEVWHGRRRPTERHGNESGKPLAGAMVAGVAVTLGLLVAYLFFGRARAAINGSLGPVKTEQLSQLEATELIASLNGWWTTDRTYDGRYWHIQDGIMETYAADGILAKQVLLDPDSVEYMSSGPGGIEGEGYYLRNIAFYQLISDPNTLHAIDTDGTADEDANLLRSDPPAFMAGTGEQTTDAPAVENQAAPEEYILPESATRVYDVSELESLSTHDLFVARNEIYARHGYTFETGELSEYFSSKSWYHPSEVFNEGDISEIERQNVSTILSIEQSRGSENV